MDALTTFLVYLILAAITAMITWMWRIHSKTHDNELALSNFRTEIATNFVNKEVERELFKKLDRVVEDLASLREEVRVALARRGGNNGQQ